MSRRDLNPFQTIFTALALSALLATSTLARAAPPATQNLILCQAMLLIREIHKNKQLDQAAYAAFHATIDSSAHSTGSHPQSLWVKAKIEIESEKGPRYVLSRIDGKSWWSNYGVEKNAPQGDPRAFIVAYGIDVSKFFGFEMIEGGMEMIVPSPKRFNWAVKQLNSWLSGRSEHVGLGFYDVVGVIGTQTFLRKFGETGALPANTEIALRASLQDMTEGDLKGHALLSHDVTYHMGAVFIPGELTRLVQRQMKAFFDFRDFIASKYPDLYRPAYFQVFAEVFSSALDIGTGNYTMGAKSLKLAKSKEELKSEERSMYVSAYNLMTESGISPRERIRRITHPHPGLSAPVEEFFALHEKDKGFDESISITQQEFMQLVNRRKTRIEAAIRLHALHP